MDKPQDISLDRLKLVILNSLKMLGQSGNVGNIVEVFAFFWDEVFQARQPAPKWSCTADDLPAESHFLGAERCWLAPRGLPVQVISRKVTSLGSEPTIPVLVDLLP